jgi:T-complex protein 1 subunit theta
MLNTSQGFQNLLKEGYRHYAGLEEAILRNIEACKELSVITRTSFGPNGMKKMVVNHIDKIFVTSDASAILKEIEVNHPAAKIIAMAAKMQKDDFGDGTNYVVTFAGELLSQAEILIKSGLHPSAIIAGYQIGLEEALKLLESCVILKLTNPRDEENVQKVIESSLAPKLPNNYQFFGRLLTRACISILQDKIPRFNADNIRVVKIMGGGIEDSSLVNGFVIARAPESDTFSEVRKAKIAVYSCPFDPQGGETKGTVLITKADELLKYSASEEQLAERIVKGLVEAGVNVVVVGGSIAELCQHFLNKYGLFVLKVQSKFELQRLCKSVGATALPRLETPMAEEMGFCDCIEVKEIGSTKVTLFDKNMVNSKLMTIVLRGATTTIMDNVERALENGVSAFKTVLHDDRFLPGGAAIESYLLKSWKVMEALWWVSSSTPVPSLVKLLRSSPES